MGDHGAPQSFLDRWRDTEPLRLYLYGITVPLLAAAVTYGWLTTEQLGAWLAVAAALFVGSTAAGELARRVVWAPASVDRQLQVADADGYRDGREDAVRGSGLPAALVPATALMQALGRCRNVEDGHRCVLPPHPQGVVHQYE
jgi:hypothetical protein